MKYLYGDVVTKISVAVLRCKKHVAILPAKTVASFLRSRAKPETFHFIEMCFQKVYCKPQFKTGDGSFKCERNTILWHR